ncbi:branched-chain amino acid ABC transporter permease [Candidatus Xianfuyuplasma coldseepsis]|uniref:Branched-chain amino acid ABC transporter permease n=1 Tax=Candidatus Xianfuyuplasma coldseepsis TaxID=2782163 RepID=A0A7L7KPX2_9MOLU|nr:branched-chain amino acid ABC transporter permease [Xianfuyuplasma coldseepsis]QMS84727.1 branched-chain amino acid ABC transporter permease [Xianfuyuplasma coldseepsis]
MNAIKQALLNAFTETKKVVVERWMIFAIVFGFYAVVSILIATGTLNRYYTFLLISVMIMIVLAASLNIATGFLGQLVLGHAGFMAIGAYTAGLIAIQIKDHIGSDYLIFFISSIGAMITAGIAGLLVGTPALRLRGDYLGIMTLGFGEIVRLIIRNVEFTGGTFGLKGIPRLMTFPMALLTTVIVVTIIYMFINSRHGRAIISIREDEIASENVGINITRFKLLGFIVASMFAGVGGSMFAFKEAILYPQSFDFIRSVEIFVVVVLGGMGSLSGTMISAFILIFVPELLRDFDQYRYLTYSSLLIIIMLYRPQGLMGKREIFSFKKRRKLIDSSMNLD